MFVNKLDIKEFRGIKSCKKPLEFSNFTVLVGRNNSGKSSILEALSLLPAPFIKNYISRKSKETTLVELHSNYKRLLYQYAGDSTLIFNLKNNLLELTISENKIKTSFRGISNPNPRVIARYFNHEFADLDKLAIFIPDKSFLGDLEIKMSQLKELIVKKRFHIELAEFLNKCVNDDYSEIVFLDPISLRKKYQNNMVYIQLKDLGSGAEKIIKIMAVLEVAEPKLVIIDDFEAGLHPSLIKLFLKWLKERSWQIIISTHSIDVLYHLVDIKLKDTTILQISKSNEDLLNYKILKLEDLEVIMDANLDPRLLADNLGL